MNILNDIQYKFNRVMFKRDLKGLLRLYRKLSGMLDNNEALPRAIDRLWVHSSENGTKLNSPMAVALKEWKGALQEGRNLTDAMLGWVPDRHAMILRAGEESGAIAKGLQTIEHIEKSSSEMRAVISKAVGYPIFVFLALFGVLWVLGMNLVEPIRQYAPESVQAKIGALGSVTDFVRHQGIFIFMLFGGLAFLTVWSMPRWVGKWRVKADKYVPYSWYRIWNGSAFLMSMSALLAAQTPVSRALSILEASASPWLRERIFSARQEVMRGKNLGEALEADGLGFPEKTIIRDMIILSERTDVSAVLENVSKEWLTDKIEELEIQGAVIRFIGLISLGGIIAWAFLSIVGIAQGTAEMGNNMK